jgi:hypothetical protein
MHEGFRWTLRRKKTRLLASRYWKAVARIIGRHERHRRLALAGLAGVNVRRLLPFEPL